MTSTAVQAVFLSGENVKQWFWVQVQFKVWISNGYPPDEQWMSGGYSMDTSKPDWIRFRPCPIKFESW